MFIYENKSPTIYLSEKSLVLFTIKVLLLIIPAIVLGTYTDKYVGILQKEQSLGNNVFSYVLFQTLLLILTMYMIIQTNPKVSFEFQNTNAGLFFVSLYFGLQSNYISNIQKLFS